MAFGFFKKKSFIFGTSEDDLLLGGNGRDVIFGGGGADEIHAGGGNDIVFGDGPFNPAAKPKPGGGCNPCNPCGGGNTCNPCGAANTCNPCAASGDTIYAGSGNDIVFAGEGGDFVYGEDGNDLIFGGDGRDILDGGYGADWIFGGEGRDCSDYRESNEAVQINLATNVHTGGQAEGDKLFGIEEVLASVHDDTLLGRDWTRDEMKGNKGDDVIMTFGGDDFLRGGAGSDEMWGGSGADEFVFRNREGTELEDGVADQDTIWDFEVGVDYFSLSELGIANVGDDGSGNAVVTFDTSDGDAVTLIGLAGLTEADLGIV